MWKGLPDPGKSKATTVWWDEAGAGGQPVSQGMNFNSDLSGDGIRLTFQRVLQRPWWGFEETEQMKGERHPGKFWLLAGAFTDGRRGQVCRQALISPAESPGSRVGADVPPGGSTAHLVLDPRP